MQFQPVICKHMDQQSRTGGKRMGTRKTEGGACLCVGGDFGRNLFVCWELVEVCGGEKVLE